MSAFLHICVIINLSRVFLEKRVFPLGGANSHHTMKRLGENIKVTAPANNHWQPCAFFSHYSVYEYGTPKSQKVDKLGFTDVNPSLQSRNLVSCP